MPALSILLSLFACTANDVEENALITDSLAGSQEVVGEHCAAISTYSNGEFTINEDNATFRDTGSVFLTKSTPESRGLNVVPLRQAARYLERRPFVNSLVVTSGGYLVFERYFNHSRAVDSNNIHGVSKSILALATGMAIDRGYINDIDDSIADYLPASYFADIDDERKFDITVRHLLTMSAGFEWTAGVSEAELELEENWMETILALPLATAPGEAFNDSIAQSHLLAAVIAHSANRSYCDFAHDFVLSPIGVQAERWGRDPQGYFSGGYNVYLSPRELAAFGKLVLHKGEWNGEQLMPATWVAESVQKQITTDGLYDYGYLFWLMQSDGLAVDVSWGEGGQYLYTFPQEDVSVTITTNTRDYDPDFTAGDVLTRYLIPAIHEGNP